MTFEEFNLREELLEAIRYMGFEKATPIQIQAIPEILKNRDLIACAQTGTGKTAAFVLPVLHKIADRKKSGINTLIVVPTRELAIQLEQQIQGLSYFVSVDSKSIYGGGDGMGWEQEKKALTSDTDIIVATPGKLISHLNMKYVKFENIQHLILDEADKMLDMGFLPDLDKIISYLPADRQTLMFSATMPDKIRKLAKNILKDPAEISIEISKPAEGVLQAAYLAYDQQKTPLINKLIADKPDFDSILIFTSTKANVSQIVRALKKHGHEAEAISSDLEQSERNEVMVRFRSRETRILVATDVISRGIDVKDINLVINYDVPPDPEDYVHRVGRTARASTTGIALTFINEKDVSRFMRIEELIERKVLKIPMPEEFGEAPEWKVTKFRDKNSNFRGKQNYRKGRSNQGRNHRQGGKNRRNS